MAVGNGAVLVVYLYAGYRPSYKYVTYSLVLIGQHLHWLRRGEPQHADLCCREYNTLQPLGNETVGRLHNYLGMPTPSEATVDAISSTVVYDNEQSDRSIPSLTLWPRDVGNESGQPGQMPPWTHPSPTSVAGKVVSPQRTSFRGMTP